MNRHPSSPEERFALAEAMEERREYAEALKLWRELALELVDASILCRQTSLTEQLGCVEEAERALGELLRRNVHALASLLAMPRIVKFARGRKCVVRRIRP